MVVWRCRECSPPEARVRRGRQVIQRMRDSVRELLRVQNRRNSLRVESSDPMLMVDVEAQSTPFARPVLAATSHAMESPESCGEFARTVNRHRAALPHRV